MTQQSVRMSCVQAIHSSVKLGGTPAQTTTNAEGVLRTVPAMAKFLQVLQASSNSA
jgi:hypothetical protein